MTLTVILLVYFVGLMAMGYTLRSEAWSSSKGYFLAGRNLSTPVFASTFAGTAFSTASVIGIPGFMYTHGLSGLVFALVGMILLGVVASLYGSRLIALANHIDTYSPVDIVARRFASKGLGVLCAIVTVCFVIPHLTVQLVGVGRLLGPFFPADVPPAALSFGVLLVAFGYSFFGGARVIAVTDVIQVVLIGLGLVGIASLLLLSRDIPNLLSLAEQQYPKHFTLGGPTGGMGGATLVSLIILLASASISQPRFSMRLMMGSKDARPGSLAAVVSVMSVVVFTCAGVIALVGRVEFPELSSGDEVVGSVLAQLGLPEWLGAIFVAGVLSAAMSTIDSQLLAVSGIFTRDVLRPIFGTEWADTAELKVSKVVVVAVAAVAFVVSVRPPAVVLELAFLALAGGMQLVPTYLMQFSERRRSAPAAVSSILVGLATLVVGRYVLDRGAFLGVDPGIVGCVLGFLTYWAVARMVGRQQAR